MTTRAPVGAEEPQHGEDGEPEDDGAGDSLGHAVPGLLGRRDGLQLLARLPVAALAAGIVGERGRQVLA